jgi:hypothetical protein
MFSQFGQLVKREIDQREKKARRAWSLRRFAPALSRVPRQLRRPRPHTKEVASATLPPLREVRILKAAGCG